MKFAVSQEGSWVVLEKEASSAAEPSQAKAEGPGFVCTIWGGPHEAVAAEAEQRNQALTSGSLTLARPPAPPENGATPRSWLLGRLTEQSYGKALQLKTSK